MNQWLLISSLLLFGASVAHSLLGEKVTLSRLFRRPSEAPEELRRATDDPYTRQSVRFSWHAVSVALFGYAMVLLAAALDGQAFGSAWGGVVIILSFALAAMAALALVLTRGRYVGWMWLAAAAVTAFLAVD